VVSSFRRIAQFHADLPDVDLWLDSSERKVDFATDEIDILITHAGGVAAYGTIDAHLIEDKRVPVAAPSLVSGWAVHRRTRPASWAGRCCMTRAVTWREWFEQIGRPKIDAVSGSNFSDHALMIDAAAAGHGVALASVVGSIPICVRRVGVARGADLSSTGLPHLLRLAHLR
jgi:LysR family transcriptional regulator, glycine cleavage system transcriptional activator